jgi:hypothetical protein
MLDHAEQYFTPEQFAEIRRRAPAVFDRVQRGDTQGDLHNSELVEFYAAVEGVLGSVEATYEFLVKCYEQSTGQIALNTFLRFVIKFMPVHTFARKCHDFFRKDVHFGTILLEEFDGDARRFVLGMRGMTGYPYASAAMTGVVGCMMRAMGNSKVALREELHPPPEPQTHDTYRIVVTWLSQAGQLAVELR